MPGVPGHGLNFTNNKLCIINKTILYIRCRRVAYFSMYIEMLYGGVQTLWCTLGPACINETLTFLYTALSPHSQRNAFQAEIWTQSKFSMRSFKGVGSGLKSAPLSSPLPFIIWKWGVGRGFQTPFCSSE